MIITFLILALIELPILAVHSHLPRTELLDTAGDVVVTRAYLPSEHNIHGELRWIRRGDALVLQTLLYTPRLRRGLQRIRKQELFAWPPGDGSDDSARYLTALDSAGDQAMAQAGQQGSRPQLLIEYVLSPEATFWGLWHVELDEVDGTMHLRSRQPIEVRAASTHYIRRAMRIQCEEGFGQVPAELDEVDPRSGR
jgi:hypothetical protein